MANPRKALDHALTEHRFKIVISSSSMKGSKSQCFIDLFRPGNETADEAGKSLRGFVQFTTQETV